MKKSRILIVDDHALLRHGLKSIIQYQKDMKVVGEAENGRLAVQQAKALSPDLVIMDITMPNKSGIEALHEIRQQDPDAKVIMCSAMGQESMVVEAIKLGALDFVVKPFKPDRMLATVMNILESE